MNKDTARFLHDLHIIADYWIHTAPAAKLNDKELVEGVIFSVLNYFDGTTNACDGVTLRYAKGGKINPTNDKLHNHWYNE